MADQVIAPQSIRISEEYYADTSDCLNYNYYFVDGNDNAVQIGIDTFNTNPTYDQLLVAAKTAHNQFKTYQKFWGNLSKYFQSRSAEAKQSVPENNINNSDEKKIIPLGKDTFVEQTEGLIASEWQWVDGTTIEREWLDDAGNIIKVERETQGAYSNNRSLLHYEEGEQVSSTLPIKEPESIDAAIQNEDGWVRVPLENTNLSNNWNAKEVWDDVTSSFVLLIKNGDKTYVIDGEGRAHNFSQGLAIDEDEHKIIYSKETWAAWIERHQQL